jgi:hypothetical protein
MMSPGRACFTSSFVVKISGSCWVILPRGYQKK